MFLHALNYNLVFMQSTKQNVVPQYEENYFILYFGHIVREGACLWGQGTF